jgi:dihydroorotate dehydrogenase (NAD+) catalytic subunit
MKRTLAVDLGAGLVLPTPVLIASGCAGTGRELQGLVDLRKVGGLVSRTITMEARKGSPPPRIAETPSGTVWTTGLQNPGIHAFLDAELPRLARGGAPVVGSVAGGSLEEYVRLIGALQTRPEVAPVEIARWIQVVRGAGEVIV